MGKMRDQLVDGKEMTERSEIGLHSEAEDHLYIKLRRSHD